MPTLKLTDDLGRRKSATFAGRRGACRWYPAIRTA